MSDVPDLFSQREVVARVDLFSIDRVAGHDTERPTWETSVEFLKPAVERADGATRARFARQVDIDLWELNYVTLPFDLLRLDHGRYVEIRLQVRFDRPDVVAKYLAPDEHNKKNDIPFAGVARASGVGGRAFGWQFTRTAGQKELFPRSNLVLFLLQRPRESTEYDLTLDVEAVIERQTLVVKRRDAKPQRPGRYRLSFDKGTFTPLPT